MFHLQISYYVLLFFSFMFNTWMEILDRTHLFWQRQNNPVGPIQRFYFKSATKMRLDIRGKWPQLSNAGADRAR